MCRGMNILASNPQEVSTLGQYLRTQRDARGFLLEELARKARILPSYIKALEEGRYEEFSAKIYALGCLRKYVSVLGLPPLDRGECVAVFHEEWGGCVSVSTPISSVWTRREQQKYLWRLTSRRLGVGFVIVSAAVLMGFLGVRLLSFASTPHLMVEAPGDRFVETQPLLRLRGKGERESRLTVNGREITVGEDGSFDTLLAVSPGVQELEVRVENKLGKVTRVKRYGVVK